LEELNPRNRARGECGYVRERKIGAFCSWMRRSTNLNEKESSPF